MNQWYVYILRCSDRSFYTGITTDLERRVEEHNSKKVGAAYTRGRRPVTLIFSETCSSRSQASKREAQIRKLSRIQKQQLISSNR